MAVRILDTQQAEQKLKRMALQLLEKLENSERIFILGIEPKGNILAEKIQQFLKEENFTQTQLISLQIDKNNPINFKLTTNEDLKDSTVILVDDVANSGRILSYALHSILPYLPKQVLTAALVARSHKSFPIDVNVVGTSITTLKNQHIEVVINNNEIKEVVVV